MTILLAVLAVLLLIEAIYPEVISGLLGDIFTSGTVWVGALWGAVLIAGVMWIGVSIF